MSEDVLAWLAVISVLLGGGSFVLSIWAFFKKRVIFNVIAFIGCITAVYLGILPMRFEGLEWTIPLFLLNIAFGLGVVFIASIHIFGILIGAIKRR